MKWTSILIATVTAAAVWLCPLAQAAEEDPGTQKRGLPANLLSLIPNAGAVTANLWRGSAPSAVAIQELRSAGIKTIIDLRTTRRASRKEQTLAQKCGMTYIHLPMGYGNPDETNLKEFLAIVENPVYQPVYVHCRQGADRTGTLVAIYRIARQNWSLPKAYSEMRHFHFKPWLLPLRRTVKHCQKIPAVSLANAG